MNITTVGLDLAKSVFQIHGVDARGKPALKKQLRRDQVATHFANQPPCLIGIEACGSAHHWARKLQSLGRRVPELIEDGANESPGSFRQLMQRLMDHLKRANRSSSLSLPSSTSCNTRIAARDFATLPQ